MPLKRNTSLDDHCESIAETIKDFRKGEIAVPTASHVSRWARQFPAEHSIAIVEEMDHLLAQSYLSRAVVKGFLRSIIDNKDVLDGESPRKFWKRANFLRLQGKGSSQADLLNLLGGLLRTRFGYGSRDCGSPTGPYFYLDDFVFTGQTVRREILTWMKTDSPRQPKLNLVFLAFHRYGQYYAAKDISRVIGEQNGQTTYWRAVEIEDRKRLAATCDVLRPHRIYGDVAVRTYLDSFNYDAALRHETTSSEFYRTESGRRVLEHEFLRSGLRIRGFCEDPEEAMRPLGFSALESFGTGTIVATYRNCPNTAPLAWWWGDPTAAKGHTLSKWYPLLPRKYRIH